jgi:hypothetical protein
MDNSIIKIINYNVWSNELFMEQRLSNLTGLIYYHNCDILCFQELTPLVFNKLIHNLGLKYPYIVSTPELENDSGLGSAIFSKYKIQKHNSTKLSDSINDNYLLLAKISKNNIDYNIATCQLEDSKFKQKQYTQVINNLSDIKNLIITGDFKINEDEDHYYNLNSNLWKDTWVADGMESNKQYTSDFKTNIFVRNNQNRYDRVLFKQNDLELISHQLIGKNYNPTPSYRYGILVHFKINDKSSSTSELPLHAKISV